MNYLRKILLSALMIGPSLCGMNIERIDIVNITVKELASIIKYRTNNAHQIIWQYITPDRLKLMQPSVLKYLLDYSYGHGSIEVVIGCITQDALPHIAPEIIKLLINYDSAYAQQIIQRGIKQHNYASLHPHTLGALYTAKPKDLCAALPISFLSNYPLNSLRELLKNHQDITEKLVHKIDPTMLSTISVDTLLLLMQNDQQQKIKKIIASKIDEHNFSKLPSNFPWIELVPHLDNTLKKKLINQINTALKLVADDHSKLKAFIFCPQKVANYLKLQHALDSKTTFSWETHGITASEQHFHATNHALDFGHKLPDNIRIMLAKALTYEQLEQEKGRYIFFSYQPLYWWIRSMIFKHLVEIFMNKGVQIQGYHPLVCLKNPQNTILSPEKADALVKKGGRFTEKDSKNRILFMNYALFANSNNRVWGSNSIDLTLKAFNWGKSTLSLEALFTEFGATSLYKKYQQTFETLEKEILASSQYGPILAISMTPEQVKKSVYVACVGGTKCPMIINNNPTDDVCFIIDTLRKDPQAFTYGCDIVEFCAVIASSSKGKHDGLADPFNTNVQITWFTAHDMKPFVNKLAHLMETIKKEVLIKAKL